MKNVEIADKITEDIGLNIAKSLSEMRAQRQGQTSQFSWFGTQNGQLREFVDCSSTVASVRDSHTVDLSLIPVRLAVASW